TRENRQKPLDTTLPSNREFALMPTHTVSPTAAAPTNHDGRKIPFVSRGHFVRHELNRNKSLYRTHRAPPKPQNSQQMRPTSQANSDSRIADLPLLRPMYSSITLNPITTNHLPLCPQKSENHPPLRP